MPLKTLGLVAGMAGIVLVAGYLVTMPRAASGTLPVLSAMDLQEFGLVGVPDVTDNPGTVDPAPTVTYADAISIAAQAIGLPASNVRVLHGQVHPIAAGPAASAWIVLFNGGELPYPGRWSGADNHHRPFHRRRS